MIKNNNDYSNSLEDNLKRYGFALVTLVSAFGIFALIAFMDHSITSGARYGVEPVQQVIPNGFLLTLTVITLVAAMVFTMCQEWKKAIVSIACYICCLYFTSPDTLTQVSVGLT